MEFNFDIIKGIMLAFLVLTLISSMFTKRYMWTVEVAFYLNLGFFLAFFAYPAYIALRNVNHAPKEVSESSTLAPQSEFLRIKYEQIQAMQQILQLVDPNPDPEFDEYLNQFTQNSAEEGFLFERIMKSISDSRGPEQAFRALFEQFNRSLLNQRLLAVLRNILDTDTDVSLLLLNFIKKELLEGRRLPGTIVYCFNQDWQTLRGLGCSRIEFVLSFWPALSFEEFQKIERSLNRQVRGFYEIKRQMRLKRHFNAIGTSSIENNLEAFKMKNLHRERLLSSAIIPESLFREIDQAPFHAREIDTIIIHHSDTLQGDVESFRRFHMEQNQWDDIGYHFVIKVDGEVEKGRSVLIKGAHAKGRNAQSIGICLVGKEAHSVEQYDSLKFLIQELKSKHGPLKIAFHHERCPSDESKKKIRIL